MRSMHKFSVLLNPFSQLQHASVRGLTTSSQLSFRNLVHEQALKHLDKIALCDRHGTFTYNHIHQKSSTVANKISDLLGKEKGHCIATLLPNDLSYIVAQWATWKANQIAVPLYTNHPPSQLQYFLEDSKAELVITNEEFAPVIQPLLSGQQIMTLDSSFLTSTDDLSFDVHSILTGEKKVKVKKDERALIIYTSGTTGPPKGVVLSHGNLHAQIRALQRAWGISADDVILHCLPLHHVHGIVNALLCPLYCGARVVMLPKFKADVVWEKLLTLGPRQSRVSVFMAVPTMYAKLIEKFDKQYKTKVRLAAFVKTSCSDNVRLMVSGSAPLPEPIFDRWREITGHTLLERYGMTEIGMALTNPLLGERRPGFVGNPFPGVRTCIAQLSPRRDSFSVVCESDEHGTQVTPGCDNEVGELLVKGANVFLEYWNKPEATKKEFTSGGWFCTGDTAAYIDGRYKILGRTSVDIIKSGGFKISALDIERQLIDHPLISDVAVFGRPDPVWGEQVAAAIVWTGRKPFVLSELKEWANERLPHYQVPSIVKLLENGLPRNHMGKVNKKQLISELFR